MNSLFTVHPIVDKKLQEYKDTAMKELNEFYGQNWFNNTPKIFVVNDRKTIDMLREENSESWLVGWSWGRRAIFILNPDNLATESSHKEDSYSYQKLIKHELGHSFFQNIYGVSKFAWINEGMAIFPSGQLNEYKMPRMFNGF